MRWLAGLTIVAAACSADVKAVGQPDSPSRAAVLTAEAPRQDLPVSAFAVAPAMLTLEILAIDNPAAQGFSVAAAVTWRGTDERAVELGAVTPFPATQPGRFVLSIPEAARMLLTRRDGRRSLRLSLLPIAADRPLADPLQVTISDPAWP